MISTARSPTRPRTWWLPSIGCSREKAFEPLPVESAGSLLGAGARALIQRGFAASGRTLDPQALETLFADYLEHYNAHIADRTRLYPGVDKALAASRALGWRQAVCTNKIESLAKL